MIVYRFYNIAIFFSETSWGGTAGRAAKLNIPDEWRGSGSDLVWTDLWRDHDGAEGARLKS